MSESNNKRYVLNSTNILASRLLIRVLGMISTIVVARILSPNDYGIIASAMIVQDLATRMQNIGFSRNLITSPDLSDKFISAIFIGKIILCSLLSGIVYISSDYLGGFFDSIETASVLKIVCWTILIDSFRNVSIEIDKKNNIFTSEIKSMLYGKIISMVVTVILSIYLGNYYALAYGILLGSVATTLIGYIIANPKLYLVIDLNHICRVYTYSSWYFISQIGQYISSKIPNIILVKYFSVDLLGLFTMASSLSYMYGSEVSASIDKANLSDLSKKINSNSHIHNPTVQNYEYDTIKESAIHVFGYKDLIIIPVYALLIGYGTEILVIILGDQWAAAGPMFSVLSLCMLILSYAMSYSTIIEVLRFPRYLTINTLLKMIVIAIGCFLAVLLNEYILIILSMLAAYIVSTIYYQYILYAKFSIAFMSCHMTTLVKIILYITLCKTSSYIPLPVLTNIAIYITLCIIIYIFEVFVLKNRVAIDLFIVISDRIRQLLSRAKAV